MDASFGYHVKNQTYRDENNISEAAASRDLKRLCDSGLLTPVGEKRGRYYLATEMLAEFRKSSSNLEKVDDPYLLLKNSFK